ncbi:MAG: hypothetical protein FD175_115 [Beijerinckiaceae bacterium]|nr:MAG: hypothetical protein FD175_115 [Beijerinckiaceae bacterium]
MIIAFLSRVLRSFSLIRDSIRDGAELHRAMSLKHPGLMGSE